MARWFCRAIGQAIEQAEGNRQQPQKRPPRMPHSERSGGDAMNEPQFTPEALDDATGGESDREADVPAVTSQMADLPNLTKLQQSAADTDRDPFAFCRRAIDRHFPQRKGVTVRRLSNVCKLHVIVTRK